MREIAEAIKEADSVIILPHINPDPDAMGSVYAISYALERAGKKCRVVAENEVPDYFNDYTDGTFEVFDENKQYHADLCLCVDCGDLGRVAKREAIFKSVKKVASIDHHHTNTMFAEINYVEGDAPAAAVIIYKLFEYMGIEIDTYIAKHLYAAICGDTGNFKYSNVNPETFIIASKLIEYDIEHWKISKAIFDTEDITSMKVKGMLTNSIETYCNGLISVVYITKAALEACGACDDDVTDIVDVARRVRGCEVAVSLKETDCGIKVSLRANEVADVSAIAELYGGGGHVKASGFVAENMDIKDLMEKLVCDISKQLKELKLL